MLLSLYLFISITLDCCLLYVKEITAQGETQSKLSASASFLRNRSCKYCRYKFVWGSLRLTVMTYGRAGSASLISTAVGNRSLPRGSVLEGKVNCTKGCCSVAALCRENPVQQKAQPVFFMLPCKIKTPKKHLKMPT